LTMQDLEVAFSGASIAWEKRIQPGFLDVKSDQLRMVHYRVDVSDAATALGIIANTDGIHEPGGGGGQPAPDPVFAADLDASDGLNLATLVLPYTGINDRAEIEVLFASPLSTLTFGGGNGGKLAGASNPAVAGGDADPAGNLWKDGSPNTLPTLWTAMKLVFTTETSSDLVVPHQDLTIKDGLGVETNILAGNATSITIPKPVSANTNKYSAWVAEDGKLYFAGSSEVGGAGITFAQAVQTPAL
jgi:hypothetical protein